MASSYWDTCPTHILNLLSSSAEEFDLHHDRLLWVLGSVYTHVCSLTKVHNLSRLTSGQKFCFFFFFWLHSMWGLSSPARDPTHTPCTGCSGCQPRGHPQLQGRSALVPLLSGNASYQLAQSILSDVCWSCVCGDQCHQHCPSLLGAPGVCWCSWGCSSCGPYVSRSSLVWWL